MTERPLWIHRHPFLAAMTLFLAVILIGYLAYEGSSRPSSPGSTMEEPYPEPASGPHGAGT
jgi:hypothetical protein